MEEYGVSELGKKDGGVDSEEINRAYVRLECPTNPEGNIRISKDALDLAGLVIIDDEACD